MSLSKLCKALLFPHIAIMIILVPVSTVFLVYSMVFAGTESVLSIVSYVLSAYTLTVWCFRIPRLISFFKTFKQQNAYAKRLQDDERLRVNISLYSALLFNVAYALLQLWLGFYHSTFWFYSFAAYYILLAIMRFFLVRYTSANVAGANMRVELRKYRACGWILLFMNLALALIVFFMVYWGRTFIHHEITTIMMAAYTFTAFSVAIVNIVRYRKYNSPVYSASKAISLAAACVSVLTLESTMLTTFGDASIDSFTRNMLLGTTGAAICLFIVLMSISMIVQGSRKLRSEELSNGKQ